MARWNVHGDRWVSRNPLTTEAIVAEVFAGTLTLDAPIAPVGDTRWYAIDGVPEIMLAIRTARGEPAARASELPFAMPIDPDAPRGPPRTLPPFQRPIAFATKTGAPPPMALPLVAPPPPPKVATAAEHHEWLTHATIAQHASAVVWSLCTFLLVAGLLSGEDADLKMFATPLVAVLRVGVSVALLRELRLAHRFLLPLGVVAAATSSYLAIFGSTYFVIVALIDLGALVTSVRARDAARIASAEY